MRAYLSILLLWGIAVISGAAYAQDTVKVEHDAYTTVFVNSSHVPILVTYTLYSYSFDCDQTQRLARTNNFKADPDVSGTALGKDYDHSGYDQGHCMSAQDNICDSIAMAECFYYTNMIPQAPGLNRGIWKVLETDERDLAAKYDSVMVYVGWFGTDKTIGPDKVVVPEYCWKVIYIPEAHEWDYYIFPNRKCDGTPARYMDTLHEKTWVNWTAEQKKWMLYILAEGTRKNSRF